MREEVKSMIGKLYLISQMELDHPECNPKFVVDLRVAVQSLAVLLPYFRDGEDGKQ
jgi:hypothetical protein